MSRATLGGSRRSLVGLVVFFVFAATLVPAAWAAPKSGGGGGGGNCNPKKSTCSSTDTSAPSVAITSPAGGSTVSGTITVSGTSSDDTGVTSVEVTVDAGAWKLASGTSAWSVGLDTSAYTNGSHTISARASDAAGNRSSASVTVTIDNSPAPGSSPAPDSSAPSVSISSPQQGSSVSGTISVNGTAADDSAVGKVEVRVDSAAYQTASGTTSWTFSLDTTSLADGDHTISARATDTSGNASAASVTVTFANASTTTTDLQVTDMALDNPAVADTLVPLGRGRMAVDGSRSLLIYEERFGHRPWIYVRDATTGANVHLALPYDSLSGWTDASYVLSGSDLWIFSGAGPMYFRHYTLSGLSLPTGAALVSVRTFGDSDSRPGDMIRLSSGALAAVWHQQGATGSQGHYVAYRSAAGQWTTQYVGFIPTRASKDALAQHPADQTVWLFNNPDAWSSIGAAHFTETSSGLRVDWTDPYFIDSRYGEYDADPENPDVVAAADASTGEIVLAYQSAYRKMFSTSVAGSYPAIARISTSGSMSFMHLPIFVERISRLGLVVSSEGLSLLHRPVDTATLTFDDLYLSRYAGGRWQTIRLGTLFHRYERVAYGVGRAEFAARLIDERIHFYRSN